MFAAVFHRDGRPAPQEWVRQILQTSTEEPETDLQVWAEGPVAWGVAGPGLEVFREGPAGPVGCVIGLIYERGASGGRLAGSSLHRAILAAYWREGDGFLKGFGGAFLCALWDPRRNAFLVGCDPLGKVPLYAWMDARVVVLSSRLTALRAFPGVSTEINEEKVIDFLLQTWLTGIEETYYRGIRRIRPGHVWVLQTTGVQEIPYFHLPDEPAPPESEVASHLREAVAQAVRRYVDDPSTVGVTVSGGLDSSVLAVVTRALFDPEALPRLPTFSITFEAVPASDERAYCAWLDQWPGFRPSFLSGDQVAFGDLVDLLLDSQEEPFPGPNLWMDAIVARRAAAMGVRQVLHGFDGNTVVPHGYLNLAEYARHGRWKTFLRELVASSRRREKSVVQEFRRWVLYPNIPDILWRGYRRVRPISSEWLECLDPRWARRWQVRERLHEWDRRGHRAFRSDRTRARFIIEAGLLTQGFTMLTKLGTATGVAFRCPYGDEDLLTLGMSLAPHHLLKDGWDRYIFRAAFADSLPPVVAWRRKKSDLSPAFRYVMHQAAQALEPPAWESMTAALADWIQPAALRSMFQRFRDRPTPGDDVRFWQAWVLARWRMRVER